MSDTHSETAAQLEETVRLLAIAEACADARDLEMLLSRAASLLFQGIQADVVAFVLPPQATPHGPAIHVSSRAPMTALTERSVRCESVQTLLSLGLDCPPDDAFTIIKGTELLPLHAQFRTDQVYPLWSQQLEFEGEIVAVMIVYGYQDWILAPQTLRLLELTGGPLSRALFQALAFVQLKNRTHEDPLTSALNRRGFDDALRREVDRARRGQRDLSLLMIDVDRFKSINDRFGHPAGDTVLVRLAARIQRMLRRSDFLCRLGGDEFAIILPEVSEDVAHSIAERLGQACTEIEVGIEGEAVTLSIGVAGLNLAASSPSDLVRRSDEALYAAKRGGRARVNRAG